MQRSNIAMPLLCRRPWTDPFAIKWVQLDGIVLSLWKLGKDQITKGVPNLHGFHNNGSHLLDIHQCNFWKSFEKVRFRRYPWRHHFVWDGSHIAMPLLCCLSWASRTGAKSTFLTLSHDFVWDKSYLKIKIGAIHKRRRNCFGRFWYPPPHVGILTLIYLTSTF